MSIDLMPGFGAFTPSSSLLDGSEADGTNLLTGGNSMASGWATSNVTLTASVALAPNGATDAASFVEDSNTGRHFGYQTPTFTADVLLRASAYAKDNGTRYFYLSSTNNGGTGSFAYAIFDLDAGTVTASGVTGSGQIATNATIQAAVNGFYKCSFDFKLAADVTSSFQSVALSDSASLTEEIPEYTGDSVQGVYIWRPKLVVV